MAHAARQEPRGLTEADRKLLRACMECRMPLLQEALAEGASIDAFSPAGGGMPGGRKAIHLAALHGFDEAIPLLRAHGADINEGDGQAGNPPLMLSVTAGRPETFHLLLDMGADLRRRNRKGYSAVDACTHFDSAVRGRLFGDAIRHFDTLPRCDDLSGLTRDDVLAEDAQGRCMLDTPQMLARIGEMGEALSRNGERLTLARLAQPGVDGTSALEKLCACGTLGAAVAMLNRQGEQLWESMLFGADGAPSSLLRTADAWLQAGALFTYDNWKGRTSGALDETARRLPETAREQIANLYQLRARLAADHAAAPARTGASKGR